MELKDGTWYYTDTLNPGRYSYQLVADIDYGYSVSTDTWFVGISNNQDSNGNGMGGFNSVWTSINLRGSSLPLSWRGYDYKVNVIIDEPLTRCIALWNGEILLDQELNADRTLSIPEAAKTIERSYITSIAQQGSSLSQDVVIPLHMDRLFFISRISSQ